MIASPLTIDESIVECRKAIDALGRRDRGCGLSHKDMLAQDSLQRELARLLTLRGDVIRTNSLAAEIARMLDVKKTVPVPKLVKRKKAKKKTIADFVPNPCYCGKHAFTMGGPLPKKQTRAKTAYDLCAKDHCQIYQLFECAIRTGLHPADFVKQRHGFVPSHDDWDHIEFVCWTNLREWLSTKQLAAYGRVAPLNAGGPRSEYERFAADVKAVTIKEDNLMSFIAVYRANGYPIELPIELPMPGKATS